MKRRILLIGICVFVAGCQPGTGEFSETEQVTPPPPIQSSDLLSGIQQQIFTPICSECHVGSQAPLGLRLESAELSYQFLVDVDAIGNSAFKRVAINDSANSFLILKVTGDPQAGQRMPLGKAPLNTQQIQLIRDWIDQGALPASETSSLTNVVSVSKPEKTVSSPQNFNPSSYSIKFSQPIDSATISQQSIQLFYQIDNQDWLIDYDDYTLESIDKRTLELNINSNLTQYPLTIVIDSNYSNPILDFKGRIIDADQDQIEGGHFEYKL